MCLGLYGGSAFRLLSMPCVFAYEAGGGYASVQSFEQLDHVLAAATRYCHFSRRLKSSICFLSRVRCEGNGSYDKYIEVRKSIALQHTLEPERTSGPQPDRSESVGRATVDQRKCEG
jgi:hypothetical protein